MVLQLILSNDDAGAPALSRSPHQARPGVVFKKKVDYHDPPAVSLSNGNAGEPVMSQSPHPARPGDLVSKPLLPFSFRQLCFTMVTLGS